jgi:choline dehydrogenase-like flavoprotein
MVDVIIVGSGAAGVAAALEFADRGITPLVLDVGHKPGASPSIDENFYDHRQRNDVFDVTIGDGFCGLSNMLTRHTMPVKLTTPHTEYVTRNADRLGPVNQDSFSAVQSFATGGLANAWGAGLYRFTDEDLDMFPIGASDLTPYFDKLTREIGISGADDDLTPFFGSPEDLLPPIHLSHNIRNLYARYRQKMSDPGRDFFVGHPRIAVLTEEWDGRPPLDYNNLEFWQTLPSVYSPAYTLEKLVEKGRVEYRPGILVDSWYERDDVVHVDALDLGSERTVRFEAKHLVLAAGAINTTKIVLKSFRDVETALPLQENPAFQFPLVLPRSLGRPLQTDAFGLVQLNMIWRSESYGALLQGSIMEITSPMRAEFFSSLPYSAHANLALIRHLLPAMIVMQLFFPGWLLEPARLSLREDGALRIVGQKNTLDLKKAGRLVRKLRRIGAWTQTSRIVRVPEGHSVHYASTLPMKTKPSLYECNPAGMLHGTRGVYVADSAAFTALPAKNMSFAMMANAMRVAANVVAASNG